MIIFGYSYDKDEILDSKVPVTFLDFSECDKVKKDDFVVIFGTSFTGSDTFSFQAVSDICYKANNIVYISSSDVYPFSLFKHKESKPLITPRSVDGAINLALEEFVLDIGIDLNKNVTILRVDILEESGFVSLINKRAIRGVSGSIFSRLSVMPMQDLFVLLQKIEKNPKKFSDKIYNVATNSLSEYSYYNYLTDGSVIINFSIKNTSLDITKAKEDGLL